MALWRDGGFAEDVWTTLDDAAPIPERGAIVVSFARWQAEQGGAGDARRSGRRGDRRRQGRGRAARRGGAAGRWWR